MQSDEREYIRERMAAIRAVCTASVARRGAAPSIVLCRDKDGRERLLEASFQDPAHRRRVLTGLQMYFAAWRVESYIFVSEAWAITRSAQQMRGHPVRPSEAEDRREILMILGVTRSGILHHVAEIYRGPDGKVWLEDGIMSGHEDAAQMGGQLTELLPPPELGPIPVNVFQKLEMMRERGMVVLNIIDDGRGGEDSSPTVMGEADPHLGRMMDEFIRSVARECRMH